MSYVVPSPYDGLGGTPVVRPAIPAGTYPGVVSARDEWLSKGTWHGAVPRGFSSRGQFASYARCLLSALPEVPAGTQAEQAAFVAPFGAYCKSMASASASPPSGPPIVGGAGAGAAAGDGALSTGEMVALGIGALVVLGVSVYSITR